MEEQISTAALALGVRPETVVDAMVRSGRRLLGVASLLGVHRTVLAQRLRPLVAAGLSLDDALDAVLLDVARAVA